MFEEKNYFGHLGVPCLERHFELECNRYFSSELVKLKRVEYGYTDNGGTGLGLKYTLIVAAIVSDIESFSNSRRTSGLGSHELGAKSL